MSPPSGTAFVFATCMSDMETDCSSLCMLKDSPAELPKPAASLPYFSATIVFISPFPFQKLQDSDNLGISSNLQANIPCHPT